MERRAGEESKNQWSILFNGLECRGNETGLDELTRPMPKSFPGGCTLTFALLPFLSLPFPQRRTKSSLRPRFTCDNHQMALITMLTLALPLTMAAFQDPFVKCSSSHKYVRIWEATLAFFFFCPCTIYHQPLFTSSGWLVSTNTALFYFWIGLPNSCIGNDVKDIGLWCLYPFQPLMFQHGLLNESLWLRCTERFPELQTSDLALQLLCLCNLVGQRLQLNDVTFG